MFYFCYVRTIAALIFFLAGVSINAIAAEYKIDSNSRLNARSGPGLQYKILKKLAPSTIVSELSRDGEWSRVQLKNGQIVWLNNKFLSPASQLVSEPALAPSKIEIVPNIGHTSWVNAVAISPNGKFALTGSMDGVAKLWSVPDGKLIRTFRGHKNEINAVAFSPNGEFIVTGSGNNDPSSDNPVRMWNIRTGKQVRLLRKHKQAISSLQFTPNGKSIVSGSIDETVIIWNAKNGKIRRKIGKINASNGISEAVESIAITPDGRKVLVGLYNKAKLYNIDSGKLLHTFETTTSGPVAISADGRLAATASADDKGVSIWNLNSGQLVKNIFVGGGDSGYVKSLAFSADAKKIIVAPGNEHFYLMDLFSGKQLGIFTGHTEKIQSLAITQNGQYILSGSWDELAMIWSVESPNKPIAILGGQSSGSVISARFHPDGKSIINSSELKFSLNKWVVESDQMLRTFTGHKNAVQALEISSDGEVIASGSIDETAKTWRYKDGKILSSIKMKKDKVYSSWVRALSISPAKNEFVTYTTNGRLQRWDLHSGKIKKKYRKINNIRTIDYQSDGTRFLVGVAADNGRILVIDNKTGEIELDKIVHGADINSAKYGKRDQIIVSGGRDKLAKIWNAKTGQLLRTLKGHSDEIESVVVSKDGKLVATGSSDATARIWDIDSGRQLLIFEAHNNVVSSVDFDADSERLLTGSWDGSVKVWRTSDGRELLSLYAFSDGSWLAITPEGFFNASPAASKHLNLVQGINTYSIDQVYDTLFRPDLVLEAFRGDPNNIVRDAGTTQNLQALFKVGSPPTIKITGNKKVTVDDKEQVKLEIELLNNGGGFGRVEWRLNGITQSVTDIAKSSNKAKTAFKIEDQLILEHGNNSIEIIAYNSANSVSSAPVNIEIISDFINRSETKLRILAVGVNDYLDSRLELKFAVPDALKISSALKSAGIDLFEDIIVETVLDSDVTLEGLQTAFDSLARNSSVNDVFVFFLAGHGITEEGKYYFIPSNFRYSDDASIVSNGIGQERWQEWFASIPARKSILLFDTCESGSLIKDQVTRGLEGIAALNRLTKATGRTILTASTDTEPALEGYKGHGVFTYVLLDAIANADLNRNKLIEVTELASHVDSILPQLSFDAFGHRQIPQMKIVGSSFPFAKQTTVLTGKKDSQIIPKSPTHVVILNVGIRETASKEGNVIHKFAPGTQLRVLNVKNGWANVAKDGAELGFIESEFLARLQ